MAGDKIGAAGAAAQATGWKPTPQRASRRAGTVERGRWYPHEVLMVALGTLLTVNRDQTLFPWLISTRTLYVLTALILAMFLLMVVAKLGTLRYGQLARLAVAPLLAYTAWLALTTFSRQLPSERYFLYLFLVIAAVGYSLYEGIRPGCWWDIFYRVGVAQILLSVLDGRTVASGPIARLGGATNPVHLGFMCSMVIIFAYFRWKHRLGRYPLLSLGVLVLSVYCLYAAFSRSAMVSVAAGLLVTIILRRRKGAAVRTILLVLTAGGLLYFLFDPILRFLAGGDDIEALENASGRYNIWPGIISHLGDFWIRGFGFQALRDGQGPDRLVYLAAYGLPSENALLQAILMGGVAGLLLWIWLACRSFAAMWKVRAVAGGLSLYLMAVIFINIVYSAGLSGVSSDVWALLATFSFAHTLQRTSSSQLGESAT